MMKTEQEQNSKQLKAVDQSCVTRITTIQEKCSKDNHEALNILSELNAPAMSEDFEKRLESKLIKQKVFSSKLALAASVLLFVPVFIASFDLPLFNNGEVTALSSESESSSLEQDQFASFHYWTSFGDTSNCADTESSSECQTNSVQTLFEITNNAPL